LIDLTGRRFGSWLVLRRAENKSGKPGWLCRCECSEDCGEERTIHGNHLRSGRSTSCSAALPRRAPEILSDRILIYEPGGSFATVDLVDAVEMNFNWRLDRYFMRSPTVEESDSSGSNIRLHVSIAKRAGLWIDGLEVDHIDGDTFNCRRLNLRAATKSQNRMNSKIRVDNTTGFKGVTCAGPSRYVAHIGIDGKLKHLGVRDTPEEAHELYKSASAKLHGEFGRVK